MDLILEAFRIGLVVEGLSFHVGSQCTNFENFVQALNIAAAVMQEARSRGHEIKILDIGGGFPVPYDAHVKPFRVLARKINAEIDRLFAKDIEILAEPGRFLVATAATAVARIIGKAVRDGKTCYYIDDSVYHTFSGIVFDHCQYRLKAFKTGATEICTVFGQTCDGMDTISQSEELPKLEIDDLVYSENIGAYSNASATLVQRLRAGEGGACERIRELVPVPRAAQRARKSMKRTRISDVMSASALPFRPRGWLGFRLRQEQARAVFRMWLQIRRVVPK